MFGKTIVKWVMLLTNWAAIIGLLMALLGSVISPCTLIYPAYFTLLFPYLVIINVGYVLFWILARKWAFLLSLTLLLFAASKVKDAFPVHFGKIPDKESVQPINILTYNTMMSGKLEKHTAAHPNKVMEYVLNSNADIVCLQEFMVSDKNEYLTKADMLHIFRKYPYKHIDYKEHRSDKWLGIATFSKFPIVHKERIDYPSKSNISIFSDININGEIVRLINNHLESNRLTEKDKKMPDKLKENFDADNITGITLHFSNKLEVAYKLRAAQAEKVANTISKSPYKVLVCGDFNDVPDSYAYSQIKGGKLRDVFSELGYGLGSTFNERFYSFRIDYVMYDPSKFEPFRYKLDKVKYSDHYPVLCQLALKN